MITQSHWTFLYDFECYIPPQALHLHNDLIPNNKSNIFNLKSIINQIYKSSSKLHSYLKRKTIEMGCVSGKSERHSLNQLHTNKNDQQKINSS